MTMNTSGGVRGFTKSILRSFLNKLIVPYDPLQSLIKCFFLIFDRNTMSQSSQMRLGSIGKKARMC